MLEPVSALDPRALEQALRAVLEQHDALRLSFVEQNGKWQAEHRAVTAETLLIQARVADMAECAALYADAC